MLHRFMKYSFSWIIYACVRFFGDLALTCACSSSAVTRYYKRISGLLINRIDIPMQILRVE